MSKWDNKRVLVTGGAGFLGSHLCERLIEAGDEVLARTVEFFQQLLEGREHKRQRSILTQ